MANHKITIYHDGSTILTMDADFPRSKRWP